MRTSKNFINTAVTIHTKRQKHRAHFLEKSNYHFANLYQTEERSSQPILNFLPSNCLVLPLSKSPFSTKKLVLRKVESRRDIYFKITSFHKERLTDEIYCEGKVLRRKTIIANHRPTFVKRNGTLFELEAISNLPSTNFVKLSDLHYSNDFYFVHNTNMYLLEWIM